VKIPKAGGVGGPGVAKPATRGMPVPMPPMPTGPIPGLHGPVGGIGGPGMGAMQPGFGMHGGPNPPY